MILLHHNLGGSVYRGKKKTHSGLQNIVFNLQAETLIVQDLDRNVWFVFGISECQGTEEKHTQLQIFIIHPQFYWMMTEEAHL